MVLYITNCVLIMIKTAKGSNPRRFIISPKNGGDLCVNGRVGKHIQICLCLAQSIFLSYYDQYRSHRVLELPQNAERKRLGRREGGEKSKQNVKI